MSLSFNRTSKFLQLLFIFVIYSSSLVAVESSSTSNIIICEDGKSLSDECNTSSVVKSVSIPKINDDAKNIRQPISLSYSGTNTWDGSSALSRVVFGSANSAFGYYAQYNNLYGYNNTASGYKALYYNLDGSYNTASGANALYNNQASYNTAFGNEALYNNDYGINNTASGYQALYYNDGGGYNTASGNQAL